MEEPARETVGPRDDGPHEHGGEAGWEETVGFRFFDPASGCAGTARVTVRPSDALAEAALHLFVPGGQIAAVLARQKGPRRGATSAGGLSLELEEPLRRWRVRCADTALLMDTYGRGTAVPIALDLAFETWTEPEGFVARSTAVDALRFVNVVSSGWFEQAGSATGSLRLGTRDVPIAGAAFRERVWGRGFSLRERWAVAFGPDLVIARTRFVLEGERHDGRWQRGRGITGAVRTQLERADDGSAAIATLEVPRDDGRLEILGESVATLAPSPDHPARAFLLAFSWDGRDALGLVEVGPEDAA